MTRLLTAFFVSLILAAPAKAIVLNPGEFIDFTADISSVPDTFAGEIVDRINFRATIDGANLGLADPFSSVEFASLSLGTTLGGSEIGTILNTGFGFSPPPVAGFATLRARSTIGDSIFARVEVLAGAVDFSGDATFAIGTQFVGGVQSFNQVFNVTQVSAVPLPAGLVLLLTGVGAIGFVGRRRAKAA
ncbi:MAG: VPLPA-CTERM sorting domain-containing protein [Pseudomonadota bacterium]